MVSPATVAVWGASAPPSSSWLSYICWLKIDKTLPTVWQERLMMWTCCLFSPDPNIKVSSAAVQRVLKNSCVVSVCVCETLPSEQSLLCAPRPLPTEADCARLQNTWTTDVSGRLRVCVTVVWGGGGVDRCRGRGGPPSSLLHHEWIV